MRISKVASTQIYLQISNLKQSLRISLTEIIKLSKIIEVNSELKKDHYN